MAPLITSFKKLYSFFRIAAFFLNPLRIFLAWSIGFLFMMVCIRIGEHFYLRQLHGLPSNSVRLVGQALIYDGLLFLKLSALLLLPFTLLFFISKKAAIAVYAIIVSFLLISYLGLIKYYSVSLVPLGIDIFGYSKAEIMHTVSASNDVSPFMMMPLVAVPFFLVGMGWFFSRLRFHSGIIAVFISFSVVSLFFSSIPDTKAYPSEMDYNLVSNKLGYFLEKSYAYVAHDPDETEDHTSYYIDDTEDAAHSFTYLSKEYPFLHQTSAYNGLGPFFNLDSVQKPNLVFVIVESLGKAYSGDKAYLSSFTPYLDSLSNHGLFFENFLSTSGRTFGVLPGLFGALPFAEKGFLEQGENMPRHLSLISLLKEQGYQTSFNYGGDATFDQMKLFLKKQQTDYVLEEKEFGMGYEKLPSKQNGFSWGYADREVFRKAFTTIAPQKVQPRLDIYLTLGTHDPFLINNQDFYNQRLEQRYQELKLTAEQKIEHRKYQKQYASFMCLDDALRYFMQEYTRQPEFKNTIFIITGDHRMPEVPVANKIDRFHVPLLIYSPLLKKQGRIASVSSHFDVAPSILALLQNKYKLKLPQVTSWLGSGLDTARTFRNVHCLPLMRNKNEILDYLDKEFYLSDDQLFMLSANMNLEPVTDEAKRQELKNKFDSFRSKNLFACQNNKIIPDSLLKYASYRE